MFMQISEFSKPAPLENQIQTSTLQTSLKRFVNQFSLVGGCVLRFCAGQQKPYSFAYWSNAAIPEILFQLEAEIAVPESLVAQPFEIFPIQTNPDSPYQVYACLCQNSPQGRDYLVCWQDTALSDHQQYGIGLYAQTLSDQIPAPAPDFQQVQEALHRTRHQLRTPLALILLYVDLLKATAVDRKAQEWLTNLRSTAEDMHVSLDHLTESGSVPAHEPSNYDLRQLLEECYQGMKPWIEQKQLTFVYGNQPLWLQVDGWKLKQVFQNLISNAIAFSPTAGQVTCEWQAFQSEVLIKISDNGPGLTTEDLRLLGTPFYSRRPGGTGLGLSIARQIVLEHRGSLWANNLPTGGAQFCIMLPRNS